MSEGTEWVSGEASGSWRSDQTRPVDRGEGKRGKALHDHTGGGGS